MYILKKNMIYHLIFIISFVYLGKTGTLRFILTKTIIYLSIFIENELISHDFPLDMVASDIHNDWNIVNGGGLGAGSGYIYDCYLGKVLGTQKKNINIPIDKVLLLFLKFIIYFFKDPLVKIIQ